MQPSRKIVARASDCALRFAVGPWRWTAIMVAAFETLAVPAAGQRIGVELRGGMVYSSVLAEDLVANPALIRQLGERFGGSVRARPALGVTLVAAAQTRLRARSLLELAIGWSHAGLDAEDGSGRRHMQNLHAVQTSIGVRYRIASPLDAGCGFGALRYFASGGLFSSGGGELSPLVECGAGLRGGPGGRAVLRAVGQAHRFRTPVLRDAGGQTGTVFRWSIQAGVLLGTER